MRPSSSEMLGLVENYIESVGSSKLQILLENQDQNEHIEQNSIMVHDDSIQFN